MLHITVSGIDKSGKTTLIKAFEKATKHKHYVVDRDPSNYMALSVIQNRIESPEQYEQYIKFKERFAKTVDLAVYLEADIHDLNNRFISHNEPALVGKYSFSEHKKIIESFFDNMNYESVVKLDTSRYSLDDCVERMITIVEILDNPKIF